MKKYFKSAFVIVLICIISISLTGCGDKENSSDIDKIVNQSTKQDTKKTDTKKESDNSLDDYGLYSDDTKIVFNMQDVYYLIYYHNGTQITGMEYIYDYQDSETAKMVGAAIKANYEKDTTVEKTEIKGSKLRIVFKKSAYENETLESIKQTYSYLEEMKKN